MNTIHKLITNSKILKKFEIVDDGDNYINIVGVYKNITFDIDIERNNYMLYTVSGEITKLGDDPEIIIESCPGLQIPALMEDDIQSEEVIYLIESYIVDHEYIQKLKHAKKLYGKIQMEEVNTIELIHYMLDGDCYD